MPTVHRAYCEAHSRRTECGVRTVTGRATTVATIAAGSRCSSDRPAAPDAASEVVARSGCPSSHSWQQGLQKGSQWFVQTTMCGRVRRRKVESDPMISSARQWRSSFSNAKQSDIQDAVTESAGGVNFTLRGIRVGEASLDHRR